MSCLLDKIKDFNKNIESVQKENIELKEQLEQQQEENKELQKELLYTQLAVAKIYETMTGGDSDREDICKTN